MRTANGGGLQFLVEVYTVVVCNVHCSGFREFFAYVFAKKKGVVATRLVFIECVMVSQNHPVHHSNIDNTKVQ